MAFRNRTKPSSTTPTATKMTGLLGITTVSTTSSTYNNSTSSSPFATTNDFSGNRLYKPQIFKLNASSPSFPPACVPATTKSCGESRVDSGCDTSSTSCNNSSKGSRFCVGGGNNNDSNRSRGDGDVRFHRTWQRCRWLSNQIVFVTLLLFVTMSPVGLVRGEITCPPYQEIPYCSCFVLDDQLHIQCSGSDIPALKKSLQVLNGPVKSYSVYDLDARATVLPDGVTDNVTSPVFHMQVCIHLHLLFYICIVYSYRMLFIKTITTYWSLCVIELSNSIENP